MKQELEFLSVIQLVVYVKGLRKKNCLFLYRLAVISRQAVSFQDKVPLTVPAHQIHINSITKRHIGVITVCKMSSVTSLRGHAVKRA